MTMRTIPIRTESLSGFICAFAPEPNADRATGEIRKDRSTGQDQYLIGVMVTYRDPDEGSRPEAVVLTIQVPRSGLGGGLVEGQRVAIQELIARPWEREGRSGVTYRAASVEVAAAAVPAPVTGEVRASGKAAGS